MKILFMCVANSARSQLAEGLAKQIFPEAEIHSAGSQPSKLNPFAVKVMDEIQVDVSKQFSKSIDELPHDFIQGLNFVITLCAEEVCPVLPSKTAKKLHWPFPDPASKQALSDEVLLGRFRQAREDIKKRLLEFRSEIK